METVDVRVDVPCLHQLPDLFSCLFLLGQRLKLGLEGLSKACHDTHGWTLNSLVVLILALIQVSAPPDIRVATTPHKSSSGTLLRGIQCDISVNHVAALDVQSQKIFRVPPNF